MRSIDISAPAKVNLSLEVLGRRQDSFHEIVSVMQSVALFDTIQVRPADTVVVRCSQPELESDDNLVAMAAKLLRDRYCVPTGCEIILQKSIPTQAGLGGGSSDAAATLLALNRLWNLGLAHGDLLALAGEIGSDTPFFVDCGTALAEGRGERLTPLEPPRSTWLLLTMPAFGIATRDVYSALLPEDMTDGETTRIIADATQPGGRLKVGVNGLEQPLFRVRPEMQDFVEHVESFAETPILVSGSGTCVFGVCPDRRQGERAAARLMREGCWAQLVRTTGGRGSRE